MTRTLPDLLIEPVVRMALAEDLGRTGDVTAQACIPEDARFRAVRAARQAGVLACGAAARTAVEVVQGTRTRIVCTRKTTPGLRVLEKYAVRVGGGVNHRFGLDDGVLIKDNHIVAAGGIEAAIGRARERLGHMVKIEVEVDTFEQLRELIRVGADAVLLDNMTPAQLREAAALVDGRMKTEASGGISLANLGEVAAAGVDIVSLGWLTHSAPILDIGLDLDPLPARAARTAAAALA